ncbi:alpha/beta hydrolase [Pendulispora brunnea]|uniref:Alpha/beta hydrolase n=1 Tax=Pendulispora brunnea TaxID=2905690 RepID=A0ABZ2JYD8_9BACT
MRMEVGATGGGVHVAGVDIAYDDAGPKSARTTLVCTHAIGHGARDFELLRDRLGGDHRVVAFDWPGQGGSGPDDAPPSSARYAEILAAFLAKLGIERPILVGNSIGGAAAFELVATRPEAARALVVANLGGLFQRNAMSRLVTRSFARFFEAGARGAWWYPRAFAAYYRMVLPQPPAHAQRARIVASAREIAPILAAAWRGFGDTTSDLRPLAPRVQVPVLVAWAMGDVFNPLWGSLDAIRSIPHARVVKLRAGHNPFLECADEAAAAVRDFEADLPS